MTLPEGRKPLLWSDMEFAKPVKRDQFNCLSGPHSTWESECRWQTIRAQQAIDEAKALRAENERLRAALSGICATSADGYGPDYVVCRPCAEIHVKARAALQGADQ